MTREVFDGMKESEREEERKKEKKDEKFYYESKHKHHAMLLTVSIICFVGMDEKKMKEISEISMVFVLSNGTNKNTHQSSCRIIA